MFLKRLNTDTLKDKKGKSCTWHIDITDDENCTIIILVVTFLLLHVKSGVEEQVSVSAKLVGLNVLHKRVGLHYGRDWTCIVRFSS